LALPLPDAGLVIRYGYLWKAKSDRGELEGSKDRPCAIIMSVRDDAGVMVVTVVPITHAPPRDPEAAIELPQATSQRLGLGDDRSWVVVSEVNRFVWPGPDLRPITADRATEFAYGFLPPRFFEKVKRLLLDHRAKLIQRDE